MMPTQPGSPRSNPPPTARPARRRRAWPSDPGSAYGDGAVIACDGLVRIFKLADLEVVALQGLDLLVEPGEMVAIVGASGSGKSTLLGILGGMDVPSAGRAVVAGYDLGRLSNAERTRFRRRVVGFVWQQTGRNLLPYLSAVENVELPMVLDGRKQRRTRALELLELVGLGERATHRPGPPVAAASSSAWRSPSPWPTTRRVVLADEPTGELDTPTSAEVFGLLRGHQQGARDDDRHRDPRRVRVRAGRADGRDPRRPDEHRDVPPHRADPRGRPPRHREEYAVLDRAGRLQLPRAHVEALELQTGSGCASRTTTWAIWPDRPDADRTAPDPRAGPTPRPRPTTPGGAAMTERYARPEARIAAGDAMVVARGLVRDYASGGLASSMRCAASTSTSPAASCSPSAAARARGKTTLLNLLGGLDQPTAGTVRGRRDADLRPDRDASAGVRRNTSRSCSRPSG